MARRSTFPEGWSRVGVTWCRSRRGRHAEVSRSRNNETGLIEWHALAWEGHARSQPTVDAFTGQDLGDALGLAEEALS